MLQPGREDDEVPGHERLGAPDHEHLALSLGDEDDLLGVVGVDAAVLSRLDDVVGDRARACALLLADREDDDEALRGVVVVPDLDEVGARAVALRPGAGLPGNLVGGLFAPGGPCRLLGAGLAAPLLVVCHRLSSSSNCLSAKA